MPRSATKHVTAPRVLDWAGLLALAATPVFMLMAVFFAIGAPDMAMPPASVLPFPINEMALMYLLMGIFHLPAWIRLSSERSRRRSLIPKTTGD